MYAHMNMYPFMLYKTSKSLTYSLLTSCQMRNLLITGSIYHCIILKENHHVTQRFDWKPFSRKALWGVSSFPVESRPDAVPPDYSRSDNTYVIFAQLSVTCLSRKKIVTTFSGTAWVFSTHFFKLQHCWLIISWIIKNKLRWNRNRNATYRKMCIWKCPLQKTQQFCIGRSFARLKTMAYSVVRTLSEEYVFINFSLQTRYRRLSTMLPSQKELPPD